VRNSYVLQEAKIVWIVVNSSFLEIGLMTANVQIYSFERCIDYPKHWNNNF